MTEVCPSCKHELTVPTRYLGKRWRCPDCRTGFVPGTAIIEVPAGFLARLLFALRGVLRT